MQFTTWLLGFGLWLSLSCQAAGPLPSYPRLYTHSNYSSICESAQVNGDVHALTVCGWYNSYLKRDPDPDGLLYWRYFLDSGYSESYVYAVFLSGANMELAGYSAPIQ